MAEVPEVRRKQKGRPTLVDDPDVLRKLMDEIKLGATYTDACRLAGVPVDTFLRWKAKGAGQKKGKYRSFLQLLERARAERRKTYKVQIQKMAVDRKDWRGMAFIATVTEREEFGQRIHVVVEEELRTAIGRLMKEFEAPHEHAILERALSAVAGEARDGRTPHATAGEGAAVAGLGEDADPSPGI